MPTTSILHTHLRAVVAARVVEPHPAAGAGVTAVVVAHGPERAVVAAPHLAAAAVAVGVGVVAVVRVCVKKGERESCAGATGGPGGP